MLPLGGDEPQKSGWTAAELLAVPAVGSPGSSHFIEGDSERGWNTPEALLKDMTQWKKCCVKEPR